MTEHAMIEQIAHAVARMVANPIPIEIDLWDYVRIGEYLKRDAATVREKYACLPSFPFPIALPSETKRGAQPLYEAVDIIEWAKRHKRK